MSLIEDLTSHVLAVLKAQRESKINETIVVNSPDGQRIINRCGLHVTCNRNCQGKFGYERTANILERPFDEMGVVFVCSFCSKVCDMHTTWIAEDLGYK